MARVLIAGATGFIGKRLAYHLLEQGHEVFALGRIRGINLPIFDNPRLHLLYGDFRDFSSVEPLPKDLDAVYYLLHSMGSLVRNLISEEEKVAANFIEAVEKTNCKQIIFLSGIIEDEHRLSSHLKARLTVEKILKNSQIPSTIVRSSIIIGAGSASFEIIRDLTEKLPLMIAPKWVHSYCQPIAVQDVIFYLNALLLNTESFDKTLDIGGPEVLTFKEVLLRYAKFRHLKRYVIDVPFLTPRLSSYWLVFVTSVCFSICQYLVESMRHNTRKLNREIDSFISHTCLTYEEGLERAFQKIAQNAVISTWMDSWELKTVSADIEKFIEVPEKGCLKNVKVVPILGAIDKVQERIWSLGGSTGWYSMNWAWKFRGLVDKWVGGIGLNRGRRHPSELAVGDSVDFWRVLLAQKVAPQTKGHLILYAEMKLPGEAWLEFKIDGSQKILTQIATFRPKGFLGRLYWYLFWPFHVFIFKNMAKTLAHIEDEPSKS